MTFLFSNVISDVHVACLKSLMTQIITTEMLHATNVLLVLFCCILASFAIQGILCRFGLNNNCIVFTIFSTKLYFENLRLGPVFCKICIIYVSY